MPTGKPIQPPIAKEIPCRKSAHGITWVDTYDWMRNRDDPEVLQHLQDENAYTDAVMSRHAALKERIYSELADRIEESNLGAPYIEGKYVYQSRIEAGADFRKYYRRQKDNADDWVLYFDAQEEARDKDYFDLAFLDVSPDGRFLAYAVDLDGSEQYCLRFRDLQTGRDMEDMFPDVAGEGEWDAASGHYYILHEDASRRPFQIYRHRLGDRPGDAVLVYEEPDPAFYVSLSKSQDLKYLFACSFSKHTTEVSYLDAANPAGCFTRLFARKTGVKYWIEHHADSWLIRINKNAPDYKLLRCPVANPGLQSAEVILPARKNVRLEDVLPLRNHLVLFERENGLDYIRIKNLTTGLDHRIESPDPVYDLHPGVNAQYETDLFTYVYSSPVRPHQTIQYHMDERIGEVVHSVKAPSGHNPADYEVYRITAPSPCGTRVPVTIVHHKNFPRNGSRPLYLYGYGAYGSWTDAYFRSAWLSFLERGFAVAIAHVRGGGLLGEEWYHAGKLDQKKNSFNDFIAVAEELIRLGYTRSDRLVIEGDSAGGLLVGAVLNMRPDLFKAAVADVPFVDVLNTMLDDSLPLTTFEYEEWGNPEERDAFDCIRSYAPYENTANQPYPAILATAAYNDARVPYWEVAKWIARIRHRNTADQPVLLRTCFDSGHAGASGRYANLREVAFIQTFLISQVSESIEED